MTYRRATPAAIVLASVGLAVLSGSAFGCSCAYVEPKEGLKRSYAAFAGTVIDVEAKSSSPPAREERFSEAYSDPPYTATLRVEEDYKDNLGDQVKVTSSGGSEAGCGLSLEVGDRVGLYLYGKREPWSVSLCGTFSPGEMRVAVMPLPAPESRDPIRLLAGGFAMTPTRLVALDDRGRVVAYGRGEGRTELIAVCPGSQRAVEFVYRRGDTQWLEVRRLDNLKVVRAMSLRFLSRGGPSTRSVISVHCRDRLAEDIVLLAHQGEHTDSTASRLFRIRGRHKELIHAGNAQSLALGDTHAYIDDRGMRLVAVDLNGKEQRVLARGLRGISGLGLSPDGTALAGVADNQSGDFDPFGLPDLTEVLLFDLSSGAEALRYKVGPAGLHGQMAWLDENHPVYLPLGGFGPESARLFDRSLEMVDSFPAPSDEGAFVGHRLYGVAGDRLRAVDLPSGRARMLQTLFGHPTAPLVALDKPVEFVGAGGASPGVPVVAIALGLACLAVAALVWVLLRRRLRFSRA